MAVSSRRRYGRRAAAAGLRHVELRGGDAEEEVHAAAASAPNTPLPHSIVDRSWGTLLAHPELQI